MLSSDPRYVLTVAQCSLLFGNCQFFKLEFRTIRRTRMTLLAATLDDAVRFLVTAMLYCLKFCNDFLRLCGTCGGEKTCTSGFGWES